MIVKILNDGSYDEMSHISFPIYTETFHVEDGLIQVPVEELNKLGATFGPDIASKSMSFFIGREANLVPEIERPVKVKYGVLSSIVYSFANFLNKKGL